MPALERLFNSDSAKRRSLRISSEYAIKQPCSLRGQDASEPLALSAGSFAETHRRRGGHDADVDELGFKKGVTLDNLGNALGCGAKSGHGTDVA